MTVTASSAFEFRKITKRFGDVLANDSVSFSVARNTIHGVVGENGAGKSTIMKILYGLYPPDSGEIFVKGERVRFKSPQQAIARGIGMVHQHFMLVPTLPVWQNIVLGKEPSWLQIDRAKCLAELNSLQKGFGFALDLETPIESLPVGNQQQVEILKLLYRQAETLILDEPTAVLTPQEVTVLFERLRSLLEGGKTIVLISHKLKEILSFTQNVTVMRRGKVVAEKLSTAGLEPATLAEQIVGRKITALPERRQGKSGESVLKVEGLRLRKTHRGSLNGLAFEVRSGEIVGIAGVEGNGQDALVECLANVRRDYEGQILYRGKPLASLSTYAARQAGLAVIPPDRHHEGLILDFTVWENFILGHHHEAKYTRGPFLSREKIQTATASQITRFDVRPTDPFLPISGLSGGNQQKVIIGRELSGEVSLLIAAHPTRGVDIGAIEQIHRQCLKLRDEGAACLLLSSELDEILALADRILVLFEGRFTGEVARAEAREKELGLWMTGASG